MAIQFSEIFNNLNNSVYSVPIFNTILGSIFYTSIILSILVIIMVVFISPDNTIAPTSFTKMFIYLFIINTLVFSAHYSMQADKYKEKSNEHASTEFITNINRSGGAHGSIKVVPNFKTRESFPDEEPEHEPAHEPEHKELTVSDMLNKIEQSL
jgi:hypothetical protein